MIDWLNEKYVKKIRFTLYSFGIIIFIITFIERQSFSSIVESSENFLHHVYLKQQ